jgi:ATP adenylyltransferase
MAKKMAKKSEKKGAFKRPAKLQKSAKLHLQSVWPQERDVMLRPERLKYVRKLIKSSGCVFCEARDQGANIESLCVFKNKWAMLVLNKYPYNPGHIMALPVRHCGDLSELSDEEHLEVQKLVKLTVNAIQSEYKVSGINIGLNMGAVAGAGIPEHLHWHIIPRWHGDTNFFPLIAETKVVSESLEDVYNRYSKFFTGLKI